MEHLDRLAHLSVGRACGFAGLGIFCLMMGLSFDPLLALKVGAICATVVAGVLLFKSWRTAYADHRNTELWLMLEDEERPPERYAQRVTANALRDAYLEFAEASAGFAVFFWASAVVLWLAGVEPYRVA